MAELEIAVAAESVASIPNELVQRLQSEFEFKPDETGTWIQSDEVDTSGYLLDVREYLPTRTRLSAAGTVLQYGLRKIDIEGTFRLGIVCGDNPTSLDDMRNFWPQDSRIKVDEDDTWLFMGAPIEPTPRGFEEEVQGIHFGIELALSGAIKGVGLDYFKNSEWLDVYVQHAEEDRQTRGQGSSYTRIFKEEKEITEGASCRDFWDRSANNLREYKIETNDTSVSGGHTKIRIGELGGTGRLGWLIANNGEPKVDIFDAFDEPDSDKGSRDTRYRLSFAIPEGTEIKTIADVAKLTNASLRLTQKNNDETLLDYDVKVSVTDHKLVVESLDGELEFEFAEPACSDCETPIWKFRYPTEEEWHKEDWQYDDNPVRPDDDIAINGGGGRSNGVYSFTIGEDYDHRYCIDCYTVQKQKYAETYPIARTVNALAAIRSALDDAGYQDIKLEDNYLLPSWEEKDTFRVPTYIDYERDGMTIRRYTGEPTIALDGTVTLKLRDRTYIDIR